MFEFLVIALPSLLLIGFIFLIIYISRRTNTASHERTAKTKGKIGELVIHNLLSQLPDEYKLLDDVVLKTKRGTTQIDHIVVSKYGIFAIETKNYYGDIYGDDKRKEWTQIIANDVTYWNGKTYTYVTKNRFYNPVKQALIHMYEIRATLGQPSLRVIPIVVFLEGANLEKVETNNLVIHDNELIDTIKRHTAVCFSDSAVDYIANLLVERNIRGAVDDTTHIRNIEAAKKQRYLKIRKGICPQCGGKLLRRKGKYGEFYGCSNYPYCKFKQPL